MNSRVGQKPVTNQSEGTAISGTLGALRVCVLPGTQAG